MSVLANPVLLRAALVLVCSVSAFVFGLFVMRRLRKNIAAESDLGDGANASLGMMPVHLYSTVIQQLKQQKHELQVQTQSEQLRARGHREGRQTNQGKHRKRKAPHDTD